MGVMMKNISQDIPDFGVVEEPKIENRRELHQFLGSVMVKTHELRKDQSLDAMTVKTYLIESHTPPTSLALAGYRVKIRETNDSLVVATFRKINAKRTSTLYIDTVDARFWTIHTVEKSAVVDPFIDGIAQNEIKKDYAWFPRQYLERFRERTSQGAAVHQDSQCILNNGYKGKFTARGHSIERYLDLIQSVRQDYADTITYLGNEIIGPMRIKLAVLYVLPRDPFIFTSEFDLNSKIIDFVNEVILRLRNYGIVIDLSEPAVIRMQHEAVEDDVVARKLIRRGLLHLRCKVKTIIDTYKYH